MPPGSSTGLSSELPKILSAAAASQATSNVERTDEDGVEEAVEAAIDFFNNSNLGQDFFNEAGGGGDEPRETNDSDGEREEEEDEAWTRVTKKSLKEMSPDLMNCVHILIPS
jgi:hypothetical protein